jgi:hypothetical protein
MQEGVRRRRLLAVLLAQIYAFSSPVFCYFNAALR